MSRRKFLLKRELQRRNHERKAAHKRQNRLARERAERWREDVETAALAVMYEIWRA